MTETVELIPVKKLTPNPENPRLIFHQEELDALRDSIQQQGILVPLTVYKDGSSYTILDGERRWRCAIKIGLQKIPVNLQAKPGKLQNLMMMFAIHHRRNEWDPLPTALKLEVLESLFFKQNDKKPTEKQLAELASLTRGEVRRYKKLLALPNHYKDMLMKELEKPRSQQQITVDHVLEATAAGRALVNRDIIVTTSFEEKFRQAIIAKFRTGVITSTVDPRKFSRLARAVDRDEISLEEAVRVTKKFVKNKTYSIRELFEDTVEEFDFQHSVEVLVDRVEGRVTEIVEREFEVSEALRERLVNLRRLISKLLKT